MAALKTPGELLDASGWTDVLVLTGVATTGTADSFLKATHVTHTGRAHQITSSSLHLLLQDAYNLYTSGLDEGQDPMSLEDWCAERVDTSHHGRSATVHTRQTDPMEMARNTRSPVPVLVHHFAVETGSSYLREIGE